MAGLFELQLPNDSRRRRSNDVSEPRLSTSRARSNSPTPEVTAKEIVSQLVAKQQAASAAAPSSSSIFPWRRKATGGPDSSRRSSDAPSRNSTDASSRSISQSPDGKKQSERLSPRRAPTGTSVTPTSPRASSSIDFTLTPSTPGPSSLPVQKDETMPPPRAASALAQAGLGLGLPPVAFPGPSSPSSRHASAKRKASGRPGTANGNEGASASSSSLNVGTVRRVKSFSRHEEEQDVGQRSRHSGKSLDKGGDVLVFSRERTLSAVPHAYSMPERWSGDPTLQKGKSREWVSDATPRIENASVVRGRQATSPPSLLVGDRDKSATRRTSWWPGRRRMDSSPIDVQPSTPPPPPIPMRSQERPSSATATSTPSLPSFRPFSPLMGDFRMTDSPRPTATSFEDPGDQNARGLDDTISSFGLGESTAVRRRHSLTSRTGRTHTTTMSISSQASSRPPSQIYPHSHRYSQSLTTSEQSNLTLNAIRPPGTPPSSPPLDGVSRHMPQSATSSTIVSTRRRSMTVNSPPVSPPLFPNHETPLLLRQPINRPTSSAGPSDPFLSGWGTSIGTRMSFEAPTESTSLAVGLIDIRRTPSTSSGSTSSLSHSASASTNRPARQRSGTTPPTSRTLTASNTSASLPPPASSNRLLRRLSSTFFSSSSTTAVSPVEPPTTGVNSTGNLSSTLHSAVGTSSPATSDASSPAWSKENLTPPDGSRTSVEGLKQKSGKPPIKLPDELPGDYLGRLVDAVSKAEVAHVLAASGDGFHTQALRLYIDRFNFTDDPLDVALRKLLMELGLPRETQQIDRVMEAFAARYVICNSGLFVDDDHPYILAFSLIMLHTDAFNKSNKNKMTKADYVKNTKLPGIPSEILECFFDNIVFAPFIFIEDPMDANATKGYLPEGTARLNAIGGPLTNTSSMVSNSGGTTILGKANKIDPYYLITQNQLGPLRADVSNHIPKSNPFLYEGTDWPWDTQRLHHLFAFAQVVRVHVDAVSSPSTNNGNSSTLSTPARRKSIALPSLTVGYGPFMGSPPFSSGDGLASPPRIPTVVTSRAHGARTLKIARAGVLARKEDTIEGGKKSTNRKWREWSVVLTGSQLLFFRDLNFASHLLGLPPMDGMHDTVPEQGLLNPDEIVSLHECIAVFDRTYNKYSHAFRFFMSNGRQFIMQTSDERSLNEWISAINYAGAFRSASVQMRGLGMSHKDVEMTGVAAATSHLHDLRASSKVVPPLVHTYGSLDATHDTEPSPSYPPPPSSSSPRLGPGSKLLRSFNGTQSQVDLETIMPHQLEGAQQFKATFDEVKAELAANSTEQLQLIPPRTRTLSMGTRPSTKQSSRPGTAGSASKSEDIQYLMAPVPLSRSDVVQSRVNILDTEINRVQRELDTELRVARNLAILTPFQRATRDRIQVAVAPLAKKIRAMRIDLVKILCYRFVLLTDLAEEERQWEQAKRDALKAATQRLTAADVLLHPEIDESPHRLHPHEEPSTNESFYSALDGFEGDHPPTVSTPLSMLSENGTTGFPFQPDSHLSASRDINPTPIRSPTTPTQFDLGFSPVADGHERYYTAAETPEEIAEEWNETRAAKRVSLVRLPSDVKLSILGRQVRNPDVIGRRGRGSENHSDSMGQ